MNTNTAALPRNLIVFGVAIPLALLVGYLLSTPLQFKSMAVVGMILLVLAVPIFLKFHYPILLFSWNSIFIVFFLPGKPSLWMLVAGLSLGIAILTRILNKDSQLQNVASVTVPLLFLLLVVVITAKLTGGIGLRSLGSERYGGKKLVYIFAGIIAYFAISNFRIPREKIERYTGLFWLSGLTSILPNLIYMAGPAAWFLFAFIPSELAWNQAIDDFGADVTGLKLSRITGVTFAGMAAFSYLLMKFGLRGVLDLRKPWRLGLVFIVAALSLLGGFRSGLITFALMFGIQFWVEGLHRTRLLPAVVIALVLGFVLLIPLTPKLPLSVQRSLSILPLPVDAATRANARGSTEWRLEMWKVLLPQIPQYLLVGKGYAIDGADLYLTEQAARRGLIKAYETAIIAGDYHSGPLSILVPFGLFGVLGFLWFVAASIRVLYRNYRFSDPSLQNINTFLFAFFLSRFIYFVVGCGAFSSDLGVLAGITALSIAVNGGLLKPAPVAQQVLSAPPLPDALQASPA